MITFKLLPDSGGGYAVRPAGTASLDDRIVSISAFDADTGTPADATQSAFAELQNGLTANGAVLAVSKGGARIYKPGAAKGAHKSWDDYSCHTANVVHFGPQGYVLVGLFSKYWRLSVDLHDIKASRSKG